jgi:hypothetical protein
MSASDDDSVNDAQEAAFDAWYERKSALMEESLGEEHDIVMHALIPFGIGGALDLYYYPNGSRGTAIATKEVCEKIPECPSNSVFDAYEFVMFTRHPIDLDKAYDAQHPFGRTHQVANAVLNAMARYAGQAELNPRETCEFPKEFGDIGGKCLIMDEFASFTDPVAGKFVLMLIMEVFRSEMRFARKHGGDALIEKLKDAGHYPYSDLDRKPVVGFLRRFGL